LPGRTAFPRCTACITCQSMPEGACSYDMLVARGAAGQHHAVLRSVLLHLAASAQAAQTQAVARRRTVQSKSNLHRSFLFKRPQPQSSGCNLRGTAELPAYSATPLILGTWLR
jgi:hypothetical protein